jgi:integrase
MNFVDIAYLKRKNIKGNTICYRRKKTGQEMTVELEGCMKEIIGQYQDENSEYIFPVLRKWEKCDEFVLWKKSREALAIHNRNLKKLAKLVGIDKHLTSYVARHSWASIASQMGVPIGTISRGMGHESEKTTQIYVSQLDYSDVARANKIILSQIAGKRSKRRSYDRVVP